MEESLAPWTLKCIILNSSGLGQSEKKNDWHTVETMDPESTKQDDGIPLSNTLDSLECPTRGTITSGPILKPWPSTCPVEKVPFRLNDYSLVSLLCLVHHFLFHYPLFYYRSTLFCLAHHSLFHNRIFFYPHSYSPSTHFQLLLLFYSKSSITLSSTCTECWRTSWFYPFTHSLTRSISITPLPPF